MEPGNPKYKSNVFLYKILIIVSLGATLAATGLYLVGFFSPRGLRPLERWQDLGVYAIALVAIVVGVHLLIVSAIAMGGRHGGRG